jgi:hypothetical protein
LVGACGGQSESDKQNAQQGGAAATTGGASGLVTTGGAAVGDTGGTDGIVAGGGVAGAAPTGGSAGAVAGGGMAGGGDGGAAATGGSAGSSVGGAIAGGGAAGGGVGGSVAGSGAAGGAIGASSVGGAALAGGTTGASATGGASGTLSCATVVCPSIPTSCKRIIQAPGACCPTCTDTGCDPCPSLACDAGTHSETAAGACCPACVDDPPDACTTGQQSYASLRKSMIDKYSSSGCKNSSDCVLVPENNLCVWNCDIPLPSSMSSSFLSNLTQNAQTFCATCPTPPTALCEQMIAACVNGKCVAVNPL